MTMQFMQDLEREISANRFIAHGQSSPGTIHPSISKMSKLNKMENKANQLIKQTKNLHTKEMMEDKVYL